MHPAVKVLLVILGILLLLPGACGVIFALWAAVVLALYPACRWFAAVKAGRPDSWLRYL